MSFTLAETSRPATFSAALNAGQERPHPIRTEASASGHFTAILRRTTLSWRLTFSQLSGPATSADIEIGVLGVVGPAVLPLCRPCRSPVTGTARLTAGRIADLKAGKLYVNVDTV